MSILRGEITKLSRGTKREGNGLWETYLEAVFRKQMAKLLRGAKREGCRLRAKIDEAVFGKQYSKLSLRGGNNEIFAMKNETRQPSTMRKNDELVFRK